MDFLLLALPLTIAFALFSFLKMNYKIFQVLYIIGVIALLFIGNQLGYPPIPIILTALLGELTHLLLLGFNTGFGTRNNAALSGAIGLFPWFYSLESSVFYAISFIAFLLIISLIRTRRVRKHMGVKSRSIKYIEKELGNDYSLYFQKTVFPYGVAGLLAIGLTLLTFLL